jgi:hypothetical protein
MVFDSVGQEILENAFQGYNACIFAYGQTGKLLISCYSVYKAFDSPPHRDLYGLLLSIKLNANECFLQPFWDVRIRSIPMAHVDTKNY